jgi:hypothetical protein
MWLLCSVSDNEIFAPTICSSKEIALRKMDSSINVVLNCLDNIDIDYDTSIGSDGLSYQIVCDDNIWTWKIFHLEMKVA